MLKTLIAPSSRAELIAAEQGSQLSIRCVSRDHNGSADSAIRIISRRECVWQPGRPRVLKMTLKEPMEDHRNKPACLACHVKIDPWGIALGRPLTSADRSGIGRLTAELMKQGDGLATLVRLLVTSDIFGSR